MKSIYRTSSLNLSAYLLSTNKVVFVGLEPTSSSKVLFVFDNQSLCFELIDSYWNDQATVNPKQLFTCLNELKDRLFAEGRDK